MRKPVWFSIAAIAAAVTIFATRDRPTIASEQVPPTVILIVVDTLRADHLGCYGYARATSPNLDALARRGVLFERAVSQAPWTAPAVGSLFTGKPPSGHGAISSVDGQRRAALGADQTTLAEIFHQHGYRTAAFITNPNIAAPLGFDQGFDLYVQRTQTHAPEVTDWAIRQLFSRDDPRPLFLYLHYMDPHSPYDPPASFRAKLTPTKRGHLGRTVPTKVLQAIDFQGLAVGPDEIAYLIGLYDAEIAFTDAEIGRFIAALDERGIFAKGTAPNGRRTILALTADHGEEFMDHGGVFHGYTAYRELTHVPLLFVGEGIGPRRVPRLVRSIDVPATLLDLSALPAFPAATGESLRPFFLGDAPDRPAVTQAEMKTQFTTVQLKSLETAEWKYIEDGVAQQAHLYDLRRDPGEQHDLRAESPTTASAMEKQLASLLAAVPAAVAVSTQLDDATNERLRQLGY